MYILTNAGRKTAESYINELAAKRKEILDAGKDTADETVLPTVEDIASDIEFIGLDDDGEYMNSWGVTDNYNADQPLTLKFNADFVEAGYIPEDPLRTGAVEMYDSYSYGTMLPGTVVIDTSFYICWKVLSNDGCTAELQEAGHEDRGCRLSVNAADTSMIFILPAKER